MNLSCSSLGIRISASVLIEVMDSREDFPRISVDTFPDWQRIETNYTRAAIARLETRIATSGIIGEKDSLSVHLSKVVFFAVCSVAIFP